MLNKYLDLLQHATEAMTSVGKTGAGAAEYFQAVGYEFLVIGLGFLYLVGIVLLVAGPVLVFYHGVFKAGFASKKLKEMYMIAEEYVNASNQCNELQYDFDNDGKKCRVEILRSCVNVSDSITKLSVRMLDTEWFQVIQ